MAEWEGDDYGDELDEVTLAAPPAPVAGARRRRRSPGAPTTGPKGNTKRSMAPEARRAALAAATGRSSGQQGEDFRSALAVKDRGRASTLLLKGGKMPPRGAGLA